MLRFYQTLADLRSVVLGQTTESLYLDFKKELDRWGTTPDEEKRKGQMEFCRDLAQFANTFGGAILIGIEEGMSDGVKVAKSIAPLDGFDARRQWMEQAVTNYLVPSTVPFHIEQIRMPQGMIIAVNVPASERLVSLWDRSKHTIEYVRRNNHGKEWMNPEEAEAHMMDTSRRAKLALRRLYEDINFQGPCLLDLVSGIWQHSSMPGVFSRVSRQCYLEALGEHDLIININSGSKISIPYGLLREAWRTVDGRIGLFLHVRIVEAPDLTLELF